MMMNPFPSHCTICGKPFVRTYTISKNGLTPTWNGVPADPDDFCKGHTTVFCDSCGWNVPDGYHAPETCEQIRAVFRGGRTKIPEAFYRAFEGDDMRL